MPPPATRTTPIEPIDLPYDEDDGPLIVDLTHDVDLTDDDDGATGGGMGAVLPDEAGPEDGGSEAAHGDDDALSQMVKDAVENALQRRKGDPEPPEDSTT